MMASRRLALLGVLVTLVLGGCDCRGADAGDEARHRDWPGYELERVLDTETGLRRPMGVAVPRKGRIWVADTGHRRVVELDAAGKVRRELGPEGEASFVRPMDVAVGRGGQLWVADFGADALRCFRRDGRPCRRDPVEVEAPAGVTLLPGGTLAVALFEGHRVVLLGEKERVAVGGEGSGPGQLRHPTDVAALPNGGVIVADAYNHRVQRLDANGRAVDAWSGPAQDGLRIPTGVAYSRGVVHIADSGHRRVVAIDREGQTLATWALIEDRAKDMHAPTRVAVSRSRVYVADAANDRILVLRATSSP